MPFLEGLLISTRSLISDYGRRDSTRNLVRNQQQRNDATSESSTSAAPIHKDLEEGEAVDPKENKPKQRTMEQLEEAITKTKAKCLQVKQEGKKASLAQTKEIQNLKLEMQQWDTKLKKRQRAAYDVPYMEYDEYMLRPETSPQQQQQQQQQQQESTTTIDASNQQQQQMAEEELEEVSLTSTAEESSTATNITPKDLPPPTPATSTTTTTATTNTNNNNRTQFAAVAGGVAVGAVIAGPIGAVAGAAAAAAATPTPGTQIRVCRMLEAQLLKHLHLLMTTEKQLHIQSSIWNDIVLGLHEQHGSLDQDFMAHKLQILTEISTTEKTTAKLEQEREEQVRKQVLDMCKLKREVAHEVKKKTTLLEEKVFRNTDEDTPTQQLLRTLSQDSFDSTDLRPEELLPQEEEESKEQEPPEIPPAMPLLRQSSSLKLRLAREKAAARLADSKRRFTSSSSPTNHNGISINPDVVMLDAITETTTTTKVTLAAAAAAEDQRLSPSGVNEFPDQS